MTHASSHFRLVSAIATAALFHTQPALAQVMQPSFNLIGEIEQLTLANPGDPASGGTITVSGIPVTIPSNMLITMPGKYNTLHDLFLNDPAPPATPVVQPQSGLALSDSPPPFTAFEAEIIGNIDPSGNYVAANLHLSQGALHTGAGFIQSINYATGEMRIGAAGGANGARVVLNDTEGVYGHKNSDVGKAAFSLDKRFELDAENSPVHAKTGFPVCVPRSDPAVADDPECPSSNRPPLASAAHFRFTCGAVAVDAGPAAPTVPVHPGCNPSKAIPLQVGDYVTYLGVLSKDPTSPGNIFMIAAYGLDAEIGAYTSPGVDPVYVFVEEAIQGTLGEPFGGVPQEATTRFRIVGFTTDPTRPVTVNLVDSDRPGPSLTITDVLDKKGVSFTGLGGLPPSNGPQLGRFRDTWPSKDFARAVRRDVAVVVVGSANLPAGPLSKLTSGFYTAPVSEYIYPEPTSFGVPGIPTPVPTENFCYLLNGGGSYIDEQGNALTLAAPVPFPVSGHAASQPIGAGPARACDGQ